MIEITAILLFITFVLIGRLTKPRQLERPVVISRNGDYHVTLAPKLNLVATLIERIAHCYRNQPVSPGDSTTLCLAVSDPALQRYAVESYLLAITLRDNLLYFQAMQPIANSDSHYRQLNEFAETALQSIPPAGAVQAELEQHILAAAEQAALGHDIRVQRLPE